VSTASAKWLIQNLLAGGRLASRQCSAEQQEGRDQEQGEPEVELEAEVEGTGERARDLRRCGERGEHHPATR
jgi:hypothetical protein